MTFWLIAAGAALILAFFLFRTLISPVPTDDERLDSFERRFADCMDDPLMEQIKEIARGHIFGGTA